eukprot:gene14186-16726_t
MIAILKPLHGFKILDLSRVLAGPWSTQIFGDLGADVIKVESIQGDDTRQWGPPFYKDPQGNIGTAYFGCTNRNKRSISIDFSKKEGQEINPKLVYCSITGFGQSGPCKDLPGYDFAIQAMGGLMSITGGKDDPYKCGVAIVDIMTGLYANVAIQASLLMRSRTGRGQHIDVSLLDVQSAFLANQAANYLLTRVDPQRIGNSHPSISPYDSLKTLDGFMVVAIGNDSQFRALCSTLNVDLGLASDPRYLTNASRVANRSTLLEALELRSSTQPTDLWIEALGRANVPCSPINSLSAVYSHPQIVHRDMVWDLDLNQTPTSTLKQASPSKVYNVEQLQVVGSPMHFSETDIHRGPLASNTPPPLLGQHTDSICASLGYSLQEIESLKRSGIIVSS